MPLHQAQLSGRRLSCCNARPLLSERHCHELGPLQPGERNPDPTSKSALDGEARSSRTGPSAFCMRAPLSIASTRAAPPGRLSRPRCPRRHRQKDADLGCPLHPSRGPRSLVHPDRRQRRARCGDGQMQRARRHGHAHANLAVPGLSERSAVLALYARRLPPLLGKPSARLAALLMAPRASMSSATGSRLRA
jgi:hypothetical protein